MTHFFTTQPSQPPVLTPLGYGVIWLTLLVLTIVTITYRMSQTYTFLFKGLQILQIIALYGWYVTAGFPLEESLPLYHCRIAMFALLLLPKPSIVKDYLAFLGLGGVLCALVYPVFDPFGAFHVTMFSYLAGHYALWVNALLYLCQNDRRQELPWSAILGYTLVINACLVVVNQLTGGNYGFLFHTPLVNSDNILLNFILVSLANIGLVTIAREVYRKSAQSSIQIVS